MTPNNDPNQIPGLTSPEPVKAAGRGEKYCVGFLFDNDLEHVALIRKQKPTWQKGKLNGIGGKVEIGESYEAAMVREFMEETGFQSKHLPWYHFCFMSGKNDDGGTFEIAFFATRGVLSQLTSQETEQIEIVAINTLHPNMKGTIENLVWLIAAAIDHLKDRRPSMLIAQYD